MQCPLPLCVQIMYVYVCVYLHTAPNRVSASVVTQKVGSTRDISPGKQQNLFYENIFDTARKSSHISAELHNIL